MTDQAIEPKTKLPCSTWFYTQEVWAYRGELPVVMQFAPSNPRLPVMADYVLSKCPACDGLARKTMFLGRKVKRWIILPA